MGLELVITRSVAADGDNSPKLNQIGCGMEFITQVSRTIGTQAGGATAAAVGALIFRCPDTDLPIKPANRTGRFGA
jgi:hypothetical protein